MNTLRELFKYNEVIYALAEREVKSRYKQSVIGILWAIIQPLSLMLIFTLVFDKFFKISNNSGIPYPILVYSTLVPWNFFSKSVISSTTTLVSNRLLVTKLYFPKEVLPISLVFANIFDLLAASLVLLLMMIIYQTGFTINLIFLIPVFIINLIFTISISLFLSAANVSLRDIGNVINLAMQVWMYATPIIYSSEKIPERYYFLYMTLNPLSPIMESYRNILAKGTPPDFYLLGISALSSVFILFISYSYFKKSERHFADII